MAFDLAQFDLSGFDVGGGSSIYIGGIHQAKITAVIGTSQEIYIGGSAGSRLLVSQASCGNGKFLSGSADAALTCLTAAGENVTMLTVPPDVAELSGSAETHVTICLSPAAALVMSAESTPCAEINLSGTADAELDAEAYTEKETYVGGTAYALLQGSASLEANDIEVCELNVKLPPGSRLIIDAVNYNILLDDENAIDCHSGVWLDSLERNTSSISIMAASGAENLSASILYTEQYL